MAIMTERVGDPYTPEAFYNGSIRHMAAIMFTSPGVMEIYRNNLIKAFQQFFMSFRAKTGNANRSREIILHVIRKKI